MIKLMVYFIFTGLITMSFLAKAGELTDCSSLLALGGTIEFHKDIVHIYVKYSKPTDLMGEPRLPETIDKDFFETVRNLNDSHLKTLQILISNKKLSSAVIDGRIIPANFEARLGKIANLEASIRKIETAKDAKREIIKVFGVPADLLGEPKLTPEALAYFERVASALPRDQKEILLAATNKKKLSDYRHQETILAANFERELGKILTRSISTTKNSSADDVDLLGGRPLDEQIVQFVRSYAGEDKIYPELGSGKAGLHGFILTPEQIQNISKLADLLLGAKYAKDIRAKISDSETVFVVLSTEDEPRLHITTIDKTGHFQAALADLNLLDVVDDSVVLKVLPKAMKDGYYDGFKAIYQLLKGSKYIKLGGEDDGVQDDWALEAFDS